MLLNVMGQCFNYIYDKNKFTINLVGEIVVLGLAFGWIFLLPLEKWEIKYVVR